MRQLFLLISFISLSLSAFPQQQTKILYDREWKGCTSLSKASFFRIATFDKNGKPVGKVIDYYITGEVQAEIEGALFIDKNDDSKSKFTGLSRGFFKSGKKESEILRDNQGNILTDTIWFENGNLRLVSEYKNGKRNGYSILYYPNGDEFRYYYYTDGIASKFYYEFNESGSLYAVFNELFTSATDLRRWYLPNHKDISLSVIPEEGYLMKNRSKYTFRSTTRIPLELIENFGFGTSIVFKKGDKKTGHGLIWGFVDWDNYLYFIINANGFYRIGATVKGKDVPFERSTYSSLIKRNSQINDLSVLKVGDSYQFEINNRTVYSCDFYSFNSDHVGFYISGKKDILFENLFVMQTTHSLGWKASGSGFFIDARGYIATNYHVIEKAKEIEVNFTLNGQKQTFLAEVVKSDEKNDLSILKIADNSFKSLGNIPYNFQITQSEIGTSVFSLGYPATAIMGDDIKFTDGKVSSLTGYKGDNTLYQVSVPIQPGNSGSPLFDENGNLIGIISAGLDRQYFENVNYAIKTAYLKSLIDALPVSIRLPNDKTIATKTLPEKIKVLSDYVVWIRVK